jgi:hypothetical protein
MNDLSEIWNLPWQALQKDLALGLGADAFSPGAAATLSTVAQRPVNPGASTSSPSWLSRGRLRTVLQARAPERGVPPPPDASL